MRDDPFQRDMPFQRDVSNVEEQDGDIRDSDSTESLTKQQGAVSRKLGHAGHKSKRNYMHRGRRIDSEEVRLLKTKR